VQPQGSGGRELLWSSLWAGVGKELSVLYSGSAGRSVLSACTAVTVKWLWSDCEVTVRWLWSDGEMGLCISSYIAMIPLCLLVAVPTVQCRARGFLDFEDYDGSGDEWVWSPSECERLWADYYDRHIQLNSAFTIAQSKFLSIINEVHI